MNRIFFFTLIIASGSCISKSESHLAVSLVDSAVKITKNYQDTSKYPAAILLLDEAIALDSNYIEGYSMKLFYEESLGHFESAIETLRRIIRIKPDSAELYFKVGFYYDLNGDSITAKEYYQRSLPRYSIMLDTMAKNNPNRHLAMQMLGMNIVMMGQEKILQDIMKESSISKEDTIFKTFEIFGKTRASVLSEARMKYIR